MGLIQEVGPGWWVGLIQGPVGGAGTGAGGWG